MSQSKKIIGRQSQSVYSMYESIIRDGYVESNSPKNRNKIYKMLEKSKIKFSKEIIGTTSGSKSLCRWIGKGGIGWDIPRIIKWIDDGRLTKEELQRCCDLYLDTNFEEIHEIFDKKIPKNIRCQNLQEKWDMILDRKWTPFDNCQIQKTIVKITIIN
ncbi:hypothetical protein QLL95_gp1132 [Cotonvirus japonicus]|uniref:Uncharacterized protein n=1 Tax=Cotonvirus japonicus TaxID=2811091 RepID=A0ABM7NS72_9VIRU|nr:hypothetical protein QLL95_gp1132 [Cotonvirus japonicus]BCS82991.1 hypothetical protein [Cotonvirus japonicus]